MTLKTDNNAKVGYADNGHGRNGNDRPDAQAKRGFELPFLTVPNIFGDFAEQGAGQAKERCHRMQAASDEIAGILREACSTNAKGAADYGAKVIEISNANTHLAFDFMVCLMDSRSMSEVINLSATQGRKALEAASAQNRELWEIAQQVATATAEPIKKSFSKVLQSPS
jgi:phasin